MDEKLVTLAHRLLQEGRVAAAMQALIPAIYSETHLPEALKLLARLALYQNQMPLAGRALQRAMQGDPADAELHALAAAGAKVLEDGSGLERAASRSLQLDPAQPLAAALLTEHFAESLRFSEGLEVADRCLAAKPGAWEVRLARSGLKLFSGEAEGAAIDACKAAQDSKSLQAKQVDALTLLYLDHMSAAAVMARHRELASEITPLTTALPGASNWVRGSRRLRVGLLSSDLRQHPVGMQVAALVSGMDGKRLEIFAYSDGRPDQQTRMLQSSVENWRDIRGQTDEQALACIRGDHPDVLIDLAGHTAGSRPRLLASRVAPFQFGYLGYLFDTGLRNCDGVIGDGWNLPDDTACARRPLRMASSFLSYLPPSHAPSVAMRPTNDPPVFGSFNHLAKLSPATVRLWARILGSTPGSRLVLCALGLADEGVRERIRLRFRSEGVEGARLELRPPVLDPVGFLRQYDDIDVALDPLPFNGGMTTLQALWQGVPVITMPGERMASRTGLSILSGLQMNEWIARDDEDYVRIANAWAADAHGRNVFRISIRERMAAMGLTSPERHARHFTDLLEAAVG